MAIYLAVPNFRGFVNSLSYVPSLSRIGNIGCLSVVSLGICAKLSEILKEGSHPPSFIINSLEKIARISFFILSLVGPLTILSIVPKKWKMITPVGLTITVLYGFKSFYRLIQTDGADDRLKLLLITGLLVNNIVGAYLLYQERSLVSVGRFLISSLPTIAIGVC